MYITDHIILCSYIMTLYKKEKNYRNLPYSIKCHDVHTLGMQTTICIDLYVENRYLH